MTSAQIDRLDAGGWFDGLFAGEPVPRLDRYLAEFADRAGFYLEVKEADCRAIADLVEKLGIAEQCFTFSFDPHMREQMLVRAPDVRRMILWSIAGSPQAARQVHSAQIVEFHADDFDAGNIAACQDAGLEVMFFTDKPDRRRFQEALRLAMTYVNIDHIDVFDAVRSACRD